MTNRKFYRTTFKVTVLSEEPYDPDTLADIHYDITNGGCSGSWRMTKSDELNGREVAEALVAQHSDPGFFQLDAEGNDNPSRDEA